ncbi:GTPase Era [Alphaproteobacteria bacterium]
MNIYNKAKDCTQKIAITALIGKPNAGKSTLLNCIVGKKVSIVTHKAQTTRSNIRGIHNVNGSQLIFVDTPGLFIPRQGHKLEQFIVHNVWRGIRGADLAAIVLSLGEILVALRKNQIEALIADYKNKVDQIIHEGRKNIENLLVIINKCDLLTKTHEPYMTTTTDTPPSEVQLDERSCQKNVELILQGIGGIKQCFFISALQNNGVDEILTFLANNTRKGRWLFDEGVHTDITEKQMAEEVTREQLYLQLQEELPYATKVETETWQSSEDGSGIKIHQAIYVLKPSQKNIVIGAGGERIKKIGQAARKELSRILGIPVHLFLYVKIRENWIEKLKIHKD